MQIGMIQADARQQAVYNAFAAQSMQPVWLERYEDAQTCDFVVLPMPASSDDIHVYGKPMQLGELFSLLENKTVFGGRCSPAVCRLAARYRVRLIDYFKREEMAVLNAIPTVEGALQIAMERTEFTLHGSHVLVCGFGRIGRMLSDRLKALGASVTVTARRESDLAWCEALGYRGVHHNRLTEAVAGQDIIFSTVPHLILDGKVLGHVHPATLIMDLASAPGSVDFEQAKLRDLNAFSALALPGKAAPKTAGEIICKTILNIYKEEDTYGG